MNVEQLKRVLETVDDSATLELDGGLIGERLVLEGIAADPKKGTVTIYVDKLG